MVIYPELKAQVDRLMEAIKRMNEAWRKLRA